MSPPLPNASKKSPRVYRNLQTKDLEDVTFADMKATGDPLSIEMHNEDELRRLVMINLARLTTSSEWTGLLTGGGGMTSFTVEADSGAAETVTNGSALKFAGGTGLETVVSSPDTITTSISNTGVTANSYTSPSSVTVNAQGQVTAITAGSTPTDTTYTLDATQSGSDVDLQLDASAGSDSTVKLVAGTNMTLTRTASDSVTLAAAGGSNDFDLQLPGTELPSGSPTYTIFLIDRQPGWGTVESSTTSINFTTTNVQYWPFIAPKTADVEKVFVHVNSDGTGQLGFAIYSDNGGVPNAKIGGTATFTFGSLGTGVTNAAPDATISLTKGTQYWMAFVETASGNSAIMGTSVLSSFNCGPLSSTTTSFSSVYNNCLFESGASGSFGATTNLANLTPGGVGLPRLGLSFA
tara:strand:- start:1885 stop:3108 length:1224 start_codon:yes stop_codon:yes gene_type:complete